MLSESDDQLAALHDLAARYPDLVQDEADRSIRPRATRLIQNRLGSRTPGPVVYPIAWTSEKQRRAYFATNGFGHGIPYRRTGALMRAWEVIMRATQSGFSLVVRNDNPAAPFVVGRWQQGYHARTGWPKARTMIEQVTSELRPIIVALPQRVRESFAQRGR
jgi:hypothetical protein